MNVGWLSNRFIFSPFNMCARVRFRRLGLLMLVLQEFDGQLLNEIGWALPLLQHKFAQLVLHPPRQLRDFDCGFRRLFCGGVRRAQKAKLVLVSAGPTHDCGEPCSAPDGTDRRCDSHRHRYHLVLAGCIRRCTKLSLWRNRNSVVLREPSCRNGPFLMDNPPVPCCRRFHVWSGSFTCVSREFRTWRP